MGQLKTIAVDLTPMLPGAANGGAKLFIIELLKALPQMMPETQFVLLTRESSHEELEILDRMNVSRKLSLYEARTSTHFGSQQEKPSHRIASFKRIVSRNVRSLFTSLKRALGRGLPHSLRQRLSRVRRSLTSTRKIALNGTNPDLLFCPFTGSSFLALQVPTVVIVYDLQHRAYPQFFHPVEVLEREKNFCQSCERAVLVTISDYVRSMVLEKADADPNRVFSIHIRRRGQLPQVATAEKAKILQALGLEDEAYFLYPANFWPHKNHEMLLTAFGMAQRSGLQPPIKLVCTGAPDSRMNEIVSATERLGLRDFVLFPGFLDDIKFAALLQSALALIFPSLFEGFGMPIIEAMAAGCPVACSDRTSLPEIAGDAALLFDPRRPGEIMQRMLLLAGDKELRASLKRKGIQWSQSFMDVNRMAREYIDVFKFAIS